MTTGPAAHNMVPGTADELGFLVDPGSWTEEFARRGASALGLAGGLTDEHWRVIYFLRRWYEEHGSCPTVFLTCRGCGLRLGDLKALFPDGYQRGACLLAGLSYRVAFTNYWGTVGSKFEGSFGGRRYDVDAQGFLLNASDWDKTFADGTAQQLGREPLVEAQWRIVRYLRGVFERDGRIPTIYEICEANSLDLDGLESLFPDGYHRGAVKLAGLRLL